MEDEDEYAEDHLGLRNDDTFREEVGERVYMEQIYQEVDEADVLLQLIEDGEITLDEVRRRYDFDEVIGVGQ